MGAWHSRELKVRKGSEVEKERLYSLCLKKDTRGERYAIPKWVPS